MPSEVMFSPTLPSAPPPPSPVRPHNNCSNELYLSLPNSHEQQPQTSHDFRLTKINEIAAELAREVQHYRIVAKKFKRAKTICNWLAGGSGLLSALSVIGIPAAIPFGAVSRCFALASSGFVLGGKKLDAKLKKHNEIVTLALAKRDSVDRLVSKAMNDGQVTDAEFQIISAELLQYNILKERVRAKLTRKPSEQNVDSVDVEKIKDEGRKQGRREAETEYAELVELRKKLLATAE